MHQMMLQGKQCFACKGVGRCDIDELDRVFFFLKPYAYAYALAHIVSKGTLLICISIHMSPHYAIVKAGVVDSTQL